MQVTISQPNKERNGKETYKIETKWIVYTHISEYTENGEDLVDINIVFANRVLTIKHCTPEEASAIVLRLDTTLVRIDCGPDPKDENKHNYSLIDLSKITRLWVTEYKEPDCNDSTKIIDFVDLDIRLGADPGITVTHMRQETFKELCKKLPIGLIQYVNKNDSNTKNTPLKAELIEGD